MGINVYIIFIPKPGMGKNNESGKGYEEISSIRTEFHILGKSGNIINIAPRSCLVIFLSHFDCCVKAGFFYNRIEQSVLSGKKSNLHSLTRFDGRGIETILIDYFKWMRAPCHECCNEYEQYYLFHFSSPRLLFSIYFCNQKHVFSDLTP